MKKTIAKLLIILGLCGMGIGRWREEFFPCEHCYNCCITNNCPYKNNKLYIKNPAKCEFNCEYNKTIGIIIDIAPMIGIGLFIIGIMMSITLGIHHITKIISQTHNKKGGLANH